MPYARRMYGRYSRGRYGRYRGYASARRRGTPQAAAARNRAVSVATYRQAVPRAMRQPYTSGTQGAPQALTMDLPIDFMGRRSGTSLPADDILMFLNNPRDPMISPTNSDQPRGFDQWSAFFENVRVNYVRCNIQIRQRTSHGLRVVLVPSVSSSSLTGASRVSEQVGAELLGITGSYSAPIEVVRTYFPARILGMSKTQYQDSDQTFATPGSNPSVGTFLHIVCESPDGTTDIDFDYSIRLLINVTWFKRQDVGVS